MRKLTFSVDVDAPVQHVWSVMLDVDTYREWASGFYEGSTYEGGWGEGDEIRFLGPNDDGTMGGLVAVVETNRPNELVSLRYIAEVQGGVDNRDTVAAGMRESYSFSETGGTTTVTVDLEVPDDWAAMMIDAWPIALAKLKEAAESA
ncbi:SRPBCC family protein [Conyzicola sp.]|uniref:SRPBCC family protein n=1 Tax=Conyzicola sp. TaxID=1969404 RepID=UPI003988DD86